MGSAGSLAVTWLLAVLQEHAQQQPDKTALYHYGRAVSYRALVSEVQQLTAWLSIIDAERIGLLLDNSPAWAVVDIACLSAGKTLIPIPAFFSPAQRAGLLVNAGIDLVLTDQPEFIASSALAGSQRVPAELLQLAGSTISCLRPAGSLNPAVQTLPPGTAKITYTSGSTGAPKGVCLSSESLRQVATELASSMQVDASYHHLSVLPLAVLLENVAGLYVALLAGATCQLEPLTTLGWRGMTDFDFPSLARVLQQSPADSLILVPELLAGLLGIADSQPEAVKKLRLVAVGGAAVPGAQLDLAMGLGLPVYQGYGLSECGSVVAVNNPQENRLGSVGKPLPHQQLRITDDGQIWINSGGVSPYLGRQQTHDNGWWPTGDRGHLDADGYLTIEGRTDNLLMTSFGRNVSPEWVERQLAGQGAIQQAVVLGGGKRQLEALLVVAAKTTDRQIEQAVAQANTNLPDYAQVARWRRTDQRLSLDNGLMTRAGLPDRDAVNSYYDKLVTTQSEEAIQERCRP